MRAGRAVAAASEGDLRLLIPIAAVVTAVAVVDNLFFEFTESFDGNLTSLVLS